jgi:branched-chain amino acid transport system permease protein
LLGVNATRVIQFTFFVSSVLAAIAGIMFALRTGVASSTVALTFALKALAIMTIGGLGDLRGALYVGLAVGIVEALAFHFGWGSIADLLVWILLIVTLIFRPAGLFSKKSQMEVRA